MKNETKFFVLIITFFLIINLIKFFLQPQLLRTLIFIYLFIY